MPPSPSTLQRDLHALWLSKRGSGAVPLRRAFDVIELRPWLGFLCLVDIEEQGRDFRYRIFGTRIASLIGCELTGRRLSEIDGGLRDGLRPGYVEVARSGAPATFTPALHEAWRTIRLSELVLPLSRDGRGTDMLLTCCYPA
ncbi:hypothetical protein ABIE65_000872 [Constrictibacter sp. MBR-5]|jgi:hypothetical protein|uniref:PAS domain-containing protein n=1 Tax=Constrictibacter sp. MBR-5 TaxID=3156467 RepID=UPI003397DE82